jgi:hypothetical protein
VLRDALIPVAAGVAGGALTAWWTAGLVAWQLYGIGPRDPRAFALASVALLLAATLAALVPVLVGLNGGPNFTPNEAVSFMVVTEDQAETDRYWNAIVDNGGEESACGWCKDRWGFSWQITPRVLLDATTSPDTAAAKRAFEAMMPMKKIEVAAIEAALRGETVDA